MTNKTKSGWKAFLNLCRDADSTDQLDQLFQFICTPEERDALAKRVELVRELLRGKKTQREISSELGISIAKITRGSNGLKMISESLSNYLKRQLLK